MSISFERVPSNLRVPFTAIEFSNSRATQGAGALAYAVLLLGQKIAAGSATADTVHKVTSADQVATLAGRGSQLHLDAKAYFRNNTSTETYVGVLADAGAGTAATATLTVTGPATASGTLSIYVGGQVARVGVSTGDTANTIASNIAAAFPANSDYPVTAAVGTSGSAHIVTFTARNKGACGNDIDVRLNYQDGEALPAGVGVAVVAMSGGATNPALAGVIAALGDRWFQVIAHPYTDATSLTALETELDRRFGPLVMLDGVAITSAAGTHSTLSTLGDGRNSKHSVIIAQGGEKPLTPPGEFAAAVAGVVAFHGALDPARPFQTLEVRGVLPPAEADLFTLEERNLLLYDGIATARTAAGGVVQVERVITTYKTNASGSPDESYLDANTPLTLMDLRFTSRSRLQAKFPRHKLADDGTRFGPGQAIVTPLLIKAELLAWFREQEERGLVEGYDQFAADLIVERNATNKNRVDCKLSPDLVNQLITSGVQISYIL